MKKKFEKIADNIRTDTDSYDFDINNITNDQLEIYRTISIGDHIEGITELKEFIRLEKYDKPGKIKTSLWQENLIEKRPDVNKISLSLVQTKHNIIDNKKEALEFLRNAKKSYKDTGCEIVHDDYIDYHDVNINCKSETRVIYYDDENDLSEKILEISKNNTELFS